MTNTVTSVKLATMKEHKDLVVKQLLELNKRFGVMISLLLRMVPQKDQGMSLKEQVKILEISGMRPRDIADILGRTASHINKELTGLRKERRGKTWVKRKHKKHQV